MEENFVTFEIAKKLKEKGFPQDIQHCIGWYPTEYYKNACIGEYFEGELQEIEDYFADRISAIHITENEKKGVIAPTIAQVLKWLREEKKIHIGFGHSPRKKWRYVIMYIDDRFYNNPTLAVDGFLKIEQAALASIEYILDNLI